MMILNITNNFNGWGSSESGVNVRLRLRVETLLTVGSEMGMLRCGQKCCCVTLPALRAQKINLGLV